MKDEALPVIKPGRLSVADVHQLASIERLVGHLLDDKDGVVELLFAQEAVEVVEELLQVALAISKLPRRI